MISARDYTDRRQRLLAATKAPYIITAYEAVQQGRDSSAPFLQEANFLYLTGISYPGWLLIVTEAKSILVSPEVSDTHQLFDGSLSAADAQQISGVDSVISRVDADKIIRDLCATSESVATLGPDPQAKYYDFTVNPAPVRLYKKLSGDAQKVIDCRQALHRLRAIKSSAEIAAIEKAIAITVEGFQAVYTQMTALTQEYEIEATLSYEFRKRGAAGHAYDPIVASGLNACTLHYGHNQASLHDGEGVLIDAGARVDGYAADITRSYGKGAASERYRAVHQAVEKAHYAIISLLKPGVSVREYHETVDTIMKEALHSVGLLKEKADYRRYFPHAISHGLGLDVHDPLGGFEVFEPGMVLTVEPGIYIPEEKIGIRIEDDILITTDGHRNLSAALPTEL